MQFSSALIGCGMRRACDCDHRSRLFRFVCFVWRRDYREKIYWK